MSLNDLEYQITKPSPVLSDFVESFWMLANRSEQEHEVVVLPDGRVDIFFSISSTEPYHVIILGLGNEAERNSILPGTVIFAVSLKLLAVEYILDTNIAAILNGARLMPSDYWGITADDLNDFDEFCKKMSKKLIASIKRKTDDRKQKLFDLIYSSNGSMTVDELSKSVYWSSRQINRYFVQRFGLSLKAYCIILRFRASFQHIKEGRLFPEENFTDQAHFIKDIKKYSGVLPKELRKNINDRFLQLSTLPKK